MRMLDRALLAAVLCIAATLANGRDVYRCDGPDGVVYTDLPCARGSVAVTIAPHAIATRTSYANDRSDADLGTLPQGASPRDVYQTLGRPLEMNVRLEGITPTERWFYRGDAGRVVVVFQHGRVTRVARD